MRIHALHAEKTPVMLTFAFMVDNYDYFAAKMGKDRCHFIAASLMVKVARIPAMDAGMTFIFRLSIRVCTLPPIIQAVA